jgi:hypothetical protein
MSHMRFRKRSGKESVVRSMHEDKAKYKVPQTMVRHSGL